MRNFVRAALLGLLLTAGGVASASASTDRVTIGNDIAIASGDTVNSVVCIFCNVTVAGNVRGDVVDILGNTKVENDSTISGSTVALGGDVALQGTSSIQGDLVIVGGDLDSAPEATVGGDREVFAGRAWLLLPFAPFVILIAVVWLAIWLIRNNTYRFPVYPYGSGL